MRLCVPGSVFGVLLAASALPTVVYSQPRAVEPGEDFPLEDHAVWRFVERGLKNQAADLQLARAPESPETVALLLEAYRPGDALMVLRHIVDRRPRALRSRPRLRADTASTTTAEATGRRFAKSWREHGSGCPN